MIHIGGSAYSGSTLLDMTLANDTHGFSCGEVHAIFHPFRHHHLQLAAQCGCGDPECTIWNRVRMAGSRGIYPTIFGLLPEVEFIVDSSKPPVWIMDQSRRSKRSGLDVRNVLIWKTPDEFLASRAKRGEEDRWSATWINYYRLYFASVSNWISIRYSSLTSDPLALPALCSALDIPYFAEKHEYWRKTQHTLFGNSSAKMHLYDKASAPYGRMKGELTQVGAEHHASGASVHRRIYYQQPPNQAAKVSSKQHAQFERIQAILDATDVSMDRAGRGLLGAATESLLSPAKAMLKRGTYRAKRCAATARVRLTRDTSRHTRQR